MTRSVLYPVVTSAEAVADDGRPPEGGPRRYSRQNDGKGRSWRFRPQTPQTGNLLCRVAALRQQPMHQRPTPASAEQPGGLFAPAPRRHAAGRCCRAQLVCSGKPTITTPRPRPPATEQTDDRGRCRSSRAEPGRLFPCDEPSTCRPKSTLRSSPLLDRGRTGQNPPSRTKHTRFDLDVLRGARTLSRSKERTSLSCPSRRMVQAPCVPGAALCPQTRGEAYRRGGSGRGPAETGSRPDNVDLQQGDELLAAGSPPLNRRITPRCTRQPGLRNAAVLPRASTAEAEAPANALH